MSDPPTGSRNRPQSVRTEPPPSLVGSRCPVCQEKVLRGRQTVCSGRCRAKRWRQTHATRDPGIRAALEAIAQPVQVTLGRLEQRGLPCAYSGPLSRGHRRSQDSSSGMTAYLSLLLLLALALQMSARPAAAGQITDLALNCAGVWLELGVTVTNVICFGEGLFLDARVFPASTTLPTPLRFMLSLDGAFAGERLLDLPALIDLPPCPGCDGGRYTGFGVGWRLPLDDFCHEGCTAAAVAGLAVLGGEASEVAFALDVPTPEPATLLLLATTAAGPGLVRWYRRRGYVHAA